MKATNKTICHWKNAASLIITAPKQGNDRKVNIANQNFNILMLKRHAGASFYPNNYVFPGGEVDKFDKTLQWLKVFENVEPDFVQNFTNFFVSQDSASRSPLFPGIYNEQQLPNEIAMRICAIRESFEESGVLLLTDKPYNKVHTAHKLLQQQELLKWRKSVHRDAEKFLDLCRELQMVPDIWSLHEWSNWLTPTFIGMHFKKRFDTVFYTCCMSEQPFTAHDDKETATAIWDTAASLLHSFHNQKIIKIGPPQMYELRRIYKFSDYEAFKDHVINRGTLGMRQWLPIYVETADEKALSVYPGDDIYPLDELSCKDVYYDEIVFDETYIEILNRSLHSNHLHLPQKTSNAKPSIVTNCAEFGHNVPFIEDIPSTKPNL